MSQQKKTRKGPVPDVWTVARHYVVESLLPEKAKSALIGHIRNRNVAGVLAACDGVEYSNPQACLATRQVAAFFKKNSKFSDEELCLANAQEAFAKAEHQCARTNRRLDATYAGEETVGPPTWEESMVRRMQLDIAELLWPRYRDREPYPFSDGLKVTSGATADRSRRRSLPFLKMNGKIKAPMSALSYVVPHILKFLGGQELHKYIPEGHRDYGPRDNFVCHPAGKKETFEYVPTESNRIEFVPKNYKTHRTIACEPTHVLPLQEATGRWLRDKLRAWGIDLRDQRKNQLLAWHGSITGAYATIDLSAASDTVSIGAVSLLLPDWYFGVLQSLRCSQGTYKGRTLTYSKFSSMGNGFTFPLETLIFGAAVRAVQGGESTQEYAVYGDDIVCKAEFVDDLLRLLTHLGFTVNQEKSFWTGSFRESCGADWMQGRLVTPFYIREEPTTLSGVAHLVNGLVAVGRVGGSLWEYAAELSRQWKLLRVPVNPDSRSGVWIDITTAHGCRLIRQGMAVQNPRLRDYQVPVFKGYGPKPKKRHNRGRRAYMASFMKPSEAVDYSQELALFGVQQSSRSHGCAIEGSSQTHHTVSTSYTYLERVLTHVRNKDYGKLCLWSEFLLVKGFLRYKR